jgi:hypothetical protein
VSEVFPEKSCKSFFIVISLVIMGILLVGCQSMSVSPDRRKLLDWKYSDLKLLDAIDPVEPGLDLIAAYSRIRDRKLQLRMDFLELDKYLGKDLYIPIDTNPGGDTQIITDSKSRLVSDIKWDYLIKMTNAGGIELLNNHNTIVNASWLYVVYDQDQDRIIIDVTSSNLPAITGQTKFQVIVTPPGTAMIADKSEPFTTDTPSPARAKLLFAFWNTFSSETPAQTLRSWAGAHAGPMSSRHGLRFLIDAADRTDSTIFLLDLLTPENISALDYINALPRIRKLADKGILGLPVINSNVELSRIQSYDRALSSGIESNPLDVYGDWIRYSDLNNLDSQFTSNFMLFLNNNKLLHNNDLFNSDNDYAQYIGDDNDCELLPNSQILDLPEINLSVNCKRLFLTYAINTTSSPLFLGGDFSKSILGDPSMSTQVFSYIAVHPWIQVLTIEELAMSGGLQPGFPLLTQNSKAILENGKQQSAEPNAAESLSIKSKIYAALVKANHNQLTDLAWQVYDTFLEPGSAELISLRENYVGQIGEILAAADWGKAPSKIESCNLDLDYDRVNECILANENIFAVIEPDGGYIPFVFSADAQGLHQVVGPTWEFVVGLSDPSSWDVASGVRADSVQVLGALADQFSSWNYYSTSIEDGKIILYDVDMTMRKSVSIYSDKIHMDILNDSPSQINSSIPLVVDPWQRFTPHWGDTYTSVVVPSGFTWGIVHQEMVGIYSTDSFTTITFNAAHKLLSLPEDPNFDYSLGHYLPYPMALVEFISSVNISVDIVINP